MRHIVARNFESGRAATVRRYNAAHPNRMQEWRAAQRERTGRPARGRGRPTKRSPNFRRNIDQQNRDLITAREIDYTLVEDEVCKDRFQLRKSGIHGLGVATLKPIAIETLVMEYKGDLISMEDADTREAAYKAKKDDNIYFFGTPSGMVVDATKTGNLARFINHSCSPNCTTEPGEDGKSVFIVALRDLKTMEELTIDYNLQPGGEISCNCKSDSCRKRL